MRYMSLVRGKILSGEKNKSNIFLEQERTSEREEEELVKRQRCIKHLICSFNKHLLSVHHELETGEYTLENKSNIVLSSPSLVSLLSFQRK